VVRNGSLTKACAELHLSAPTVSAQWLERHAVRPLIAGAFEDYALLREFARAGRGVAPVPSVLLKQLHKESGLRELGAARKVRGEFYAISMERNIKHPAVLAICKQAEAVFEQRS
jgi:LysR family transcriptional activator of nhaA